MDSSIIESLIPGDDNAHEHVLSVKKLHEQQLVTYQLTGIHELDDVVEQVHEIIVTEIQEDEKHDVMELQLVVENDEMLVNVEHEQNAVAQLMD